MFEGERQLLGLPRVAVHEQDAGLAVGVDQPAGGVVVEQLVGLEPADADGELGHPVAGDLLLEPLDRLPGPHLDRVAVHLLALEVEHHLVGAVEQLDVALVGVVGADDHLDVERLALADLGRDVDGRPLHLQLDAARQRHGVDRHAAAQRRPHGVAGRLVAVAQEHDPRDVRRRDGGPGHLQGGGDVRPLLVDDDGGVAVVDDRPRLGPEPDERRLVVAGRGRRLVQEPLNGRLRLVADAEAVVDDEHDVAVPGGLEPRHAAEGGDEQDDDQGAGGERRHPLPLREVGQPAVEVPHDHRQDQQPEQHPRLCQLKRHSTNPSPRTKTDGIDPQITQRTQIRSQKTAAVSAL